MMKHFRLLSILLLVVFALIPLASEHIGGPVGMYMLFAMADRHADWEWYVGVGAIAFLLLATIPFRWSHKISISLGCIGVLSALVFTGRMIVQMIELNPYVRIFWSVIGTAAFFIVLFFHIRIMVNLWPKEPASANVR